MTAGWTTDRVGNARLTRLAGQGIIRPLARGNADRMDRREVDDVKAHRLRVIDAAKALAECRAMIGMALGRAGEELIPCGKARTLTIDTHTLKGRIGGGEGAIGPLGHELSQSSIGTGGKQSGGIGSGSDSLGMSEEFLGRGILAGARGGGADHQGSFGGFRRKRGGSPLHFLADLLDPGKEGVAPGLDSPLGESDSACGEGSRPAVVANRTHRGFVPLPGSGIAPFHHCRDNIVTFLENVGVGSDGFTRNTLDGIFPSLDLGPEILDDDGLEHLS